MQSAFLCRSHRHRQSYLHLHSWWTTGVRWLTSPGDRNHCVQYLTPSTSGNSCVSYHSTSSPLPLLCSATDVRPRIVRGVDPARSHDPVTCQFSTASVGVLSHTASHQHINTFSLRSHRSLSHPAQLEIPSPLCVRELSNSNTNSSGVCDKFSEAGVGIASKNQPYNKLVSFFAGGADTTVAAVSAGAFRKYFQQNCFLKSQGSKNLLLTSFSSPSVNLSRRLHTSSVCLSVDFWEGGSAGIADRRGIHNQQKQGALNSPVTMETDSQDAGAAAAGEVLELAPEDLKIRENLREIFLSAVNSVMPRALLEKVVKFNPETQTLTVQDRDYEVNRNVFVVGFGKGVLGMGRMVEDLIGPHIIRGILSVPVGATKNCKPENCLKPGSKLSTREGSVNNLPDARAFATARDIHKLVSNLTAKDIVIVLISGGGSALLPYPLEPLNVEDVVTATQQLFLRGATISDVNTCRRHLELLKGGGLARAAMPAQVISLIISDVIGDPLELIASGPTVRQQHSPQRCLEVIDSYAAREAMPEKVMTFLESRRKELLHQSKISGMGLRESSSPTDPVDWGRVQNVLVGSIALACEAALQFAQEKEFVGSILSHTLCGEARATGVLLASIARYLWRVCQPMRTTGDKDLVQLELDMASHGFSKEKLNEMCTKAKNAHNSSRAFCLVAGGETTVNVTGTGKGGRNQELVLAAGMELEKCLTVKTERKPRADIFIFSAGTDGQDGPTDAAGAVVDENFMVDVARQGIDPKTFLNNNDSHSLWSAFCGGRDHVVTGLTGTNVMDIQFVVISCVR